MTTPPSASPIDFPPTRVSNPAQGASGSPPGLIDVKGLAAWLGVEVVFVRRLVAERRIPFVKIGKFVRFDPDEVAQWIDARRVSFEQPRRTRRGARRR
jgi:excisionase family DNA binding protein